MSTVISREEINHSIMMHTFVRLTTTKVQHAFQRRINDVRLECLLGMDNDLVAATVKWIFGEDLLPNEDSYWVDINIMSCFVGTMLDLGKPTPIITKMM